MVIPENPANYLDTAGDQTKKQQKKCLKKTYKKLQSSGVFIQVLAKTCDSDLPPPTRHGMTFHFGLALRDWRLDFDLPQKTLSVLRACVQVHPD